ncbi:nudix hydrolase 2-like [Argentina anserina]|uniref:nudix hydrolase 2-like n=1 Tax=Argentina anserina TaxID=57926 RepID=UPI0021763FDF|nr:nudix hydrolase 2-like [Potentilla anserina]
MGKLLSYTSDEYGGVIVQMDGDSSMDSPTFVSSLNSSLALWKQQGKKGIWLRLPIQQAYLVEAAVQRGFWYHHAERHYLMLVYWIPKSDHTLPQNATHRLGIGAFLINHNREVLVVQEKGGEYGGKGLWKLPTGAVDEGEDIYAAAVREVKEETGIDSEFVEILAFRQIHKSFFEKSDLFFLCMLRPLSFDIQKQDQEIEAAKWMPLEEYAAQPFVQKYEFLRYLHDICKAKIDGNYTGFSPIPTRSYSVQKSYLYLNVTEAPKKHSKL